MTRYFLVAVLALLSLLANAQGPVEIGFTGRVTGGMGTMNFRHMEAYLRSEDVLTNSLNFTGTALETGASIEAVLAKKVHTGFSGHYVFFPTKTSENGELFMLRRGFMFNAGYNLLNRNMVLGALYLGFGVESHKFDIINTSANDTIAFLKHPSDPLLPGQSAEYSLRGTGYEIGFSVKRIYQLGDVEGGKFWGMVFGADVGVRYLLDIDRFDDVGNVEAKYSHPLAAYLRLTLGAGWYKR